MKVYAIGGVLLLVSAAFAWWIAPSMARFHLRLWWPSHSETTEYRAVRLYRGVAAAMGVLAIITVVVGTLRPTW
jgi:hypothetical protein